MKSNVITLNNNTELQIILNEIEKTARYNELDAKPSLRLRLLGEEIMGLIPHFLKYCDGEFWVENKGNEYEIHVSFKAPALRDSEKSNLIAISNTGKNAAYVGIMGKIRGVVEYMLGGYTSETEIAFYEPSVQDFYLTGSISSTDYSSMWSLYNYSENVKGNKEQEWDELEKSIVANLADDLSVGIKGDKVDIIVRKAF